MLEATCDEDRYKIIIRTTEIMELLQFILQTKGERRGKKRKRKKTSMQIGIKRALDIIDWEVWPL